MIKRWMAVPIILAVLSEGCTYSLATPTSIASQPIEASATVSMTGTPPASLATTTSVPSDTATPPAPTATFTLPPATPTIQISTPVPLAPTPIPMKYQLQPGTPAVISGFVHSDLGCNWMGVGGQVFALDSTPVKQLVVELGGTLNGQAISQLSLTGTATLWGPGGFEFSLANHPIDSSGTLWLRLLDLNGNPLSNRIYFTTYSDCSKNTVLINLIEIAGNVNIHTYLPIIGR